MSPAKSGQTQAAKEQPRLDAGRLATLVGRFREIGLLLVLLLIMAVVGFQVPRFLAVDNVLQILLSSSILAIVVVGQTLVILTRNIDLSVGSTLGFVAFVSADTLSQNPGLGVTGTLVLGCGLGAVLGAVNGVIVTVGRVPAIVATLGTLYVYRGLTYYVAGGRQVDAADMPDRFTNLATAHILGIPSLVLFALAIVTVFAYLLHSSRTGRQLYAIGSSPEAARLAGVRREILVFGAFVISGLLCGLAGVLWASRFATVDAQAASGLELGVVAAALVGGVNIFGGSGTVFGAALGAVVLGTLGNALTLLKISPFWLQAINGVAILIAVTVDALITRRLRRALTLRRNR